MTSVLDKFILKYEDIKGYSGGIKDKLTRKFKVKKHPFLKAHKLDKGWAEKIDKPIKAKKTSTTTRKKTAQRTKKNS